MPLIGFNCIIDPPPSSSVQNLIDPDTKVLVKFDYSTAMPIRDENGRCIKVKPGEEQNLSSFQFQKTAHR